ncbi:ABC transporter ATP-binding protein [Arthrobacter sp. D1-17]
MNGQLAAGATTLRACIESFTFHGDSFPAVQGVELVAAPGSLTAVLGGSGSGKSTLGRLLAAWLASGRDGKLTGTLHLDGGSSIHDDGGPLTFAGDDSDPRIDPAAWAEHVGYVPQDPAAMLSGVRSTVAEELAFGLENLGVPRAHMMQLVADTAMRTGLTALLERDPATLSGGELRRLAVGCAVVTNPAVLVLDEPLASLDSTGSLAVTELVADVLARGTAVVVLSQQADPLIRQAAQWLVLDGGRLAAAGPPDRLLAGASLAGFGIVLPGPAGRVCSKAEPRMVATSGDAPAPAALAAALELDGVSFGFDGTNSAGRLLLQKVDLSVRPGEILAVTGRNGAGKSTLLRLCNGLLRPAQGEVRVGGEPITGVPTGIVAARLGLMFQHPQHQLFERTVQREVLFGLDRLYGKQAQAKAAEALTAVGLERSPGAHPYELSSSAQRLLALATVLAREPAVLALDEPTVALDAHGLDRLAAVIAQAVDRGAAVVMVTHDLAFAHAHADRTVELRNGRLYGARHRDS